ncbi:MAG TPA: hypothetical protein VNS08_15050 [Ureibacillus sp.]|nr:hypothetical protein [Ureibacillus sp.]
MSGFFEFEYKGLNILDEVSTVEVAIDDNHQVIHIYDINQVVEPEFNFSTNEFQMSDGFFKMANLIYKKRFSVSPDQTVEQWINEKVWIFYGSKKSIIKYEGSQIVEIPKGWDLAKENEQGHLLYKKYFLRVI